MKSTLRRSTIAVVTGLALVVAAIVPWTAPAGGGRGAAWASAAFPVVQATFAQLAMSPAR